MRWVRLQWYGHVQRRDESYIGRRIESIIVRGRKGRGRPKKRWRNCEKRKDSKEKSLLGNAEGSYIIEDCLEKTDPV